MMGHKIFQPKRLYEFSLEDRVPADHLLRQVAAVVDFSFVRRLTARFYSHQRTGPGHGRGGPCRPGRSARPPPERSSEWLPGADE